MRKLALLLLVNLIILSVLITSCGSVGKLHTEKFYPLSLDKNILQLGTTKDFDRFVFEYNKKFLGRRFLTVTAFGKDGSILNQPYTPLEKTDKFPAVRLPVLYYGHLVLTKADFQKKINASRDYYFLPYSYKKNYVGYRIQGAGIGTMQYETLDPSPPAE
jgi:hypothetical protein